MLAGLLSSTMIFARASEQHKGTDYYYATAKNAAIAHLELVLSVAGAMEVMTPGYWYAGVKELSGVPALTPIQCARIARLPA